ncbi:hypothetical protein ICV35_25130, partial [Rhodococcus ruber]|nr:hypothetical protein [Rhodococcus ruber]
MSTKYELATETSEFPGRTLHRIKALRDIPLHGVKAGDLGGWIENERNLSQDGDCWVGGNASVWGNARVWGNASVGGNARV